MLLDSGFNGQDGKRYSQHDWRPELTVANSGLNNSCVANRYIYIIVMLTKLISISIKCFILSTTPFDFIIGRNTIKKHHLINRFPNYCGLFTKKINDITKETGNTPSDLPSTKVRKVRAAQNTKYICCTCACQCTPNDGIFIYYRA